jgi:hypothetical protein
MYMNPWRRLGLAYPEQAPVQHVCGMLLEVDQDKQQPVLRRQQRTVPTGRIASRLLATPVQGPVGHIVQERRPKGAMESPI